MTNFTVIYTIMRLDQYGLKHTRLYRTSNNCDYRNCDPTEIPV